MRKDAILAKCRTRFTASNDVESEEENDRAEQDATVGSAGREQLTLMSVVTSCLSERVRHVDCKKLEGAQRSLQVCPFRPPQLLVTVFSLLLPVFLSRVTPNIQMASSQDSSSVLGSASFTRPSSHAGATDTPVTASDFLLGAYDPAKLHPMAGLEDKLDYLLLDDDKTSDLPGSGTAIPSRGWSDDLCYGTGTMYLSGSYLTCSIFHHPLLSPYIIGLDAPCVIFCRAALSRYL